MDENQGETEVDDTMPVKVKEEKGDVRVVVFLDALDPEWVNTDFLEMTYEGKVDSGVPRVTPKILGDMLSGTTPEHHGLLCPTRPFPGDSIDRPQMKTILHEMAKDKRVVSYKIPFTKGIILPGRSVCVGTGAGGEQQGQVNPTLHIPQSTPGPSEGAERMFHSAVDYAKSMFSTMRTLMRGDAADVYFISFRNIDSFVHYHFEEGTRDRLIDVVSAELEDILHSGDNIELMWFSDHGGVKKEETFRLNRWLIENDYLDVTILHKNLEMMRRKQKSEYVNQVSILSPLVQIEDDSQFASFDAYDCTISKLDEDADEGELIDELKSTGYFRDVYHKSELYEEDGKFYETLPHIIPDRGDGVFVSGNIHPDAEKGGNVGDIRSGVHSRNGCWGTTKEGMDFPDIVETWEMYDVFKDFVSDMEAGSLSDEEEEVIRDRLESLGYI